MKLTTVGIDLAKNIFQVHGVDARSRVLLRKQLKRAEMLNFFANLEPCAIGMEACGSAHYWARKLQALGHTVKLMPPQFVKPYVKGNKNDAADAEAICEAVQRPTMHFVPIKNTEQQAVLALHRARAAFVKARTAQVNQIRGLLSEFGIVLPQGRIKLSERLAAVLEDAENDLPETMRSLMDRLRQHLHVLDTEAAALEKAIQTWHWQEPTSRKLAAIPGVGPLTASALIASVGDAKSFKNGRQLAAWLGLVPRQHSSGGKPRLLGISKRGDAYLRTLLIHGARAVIRQAQKRECEEGWLARLLARRHKNVAAVALANKNARTIWALLAHDSTYRTDYTAAKAAA